MTATSASSIATVAGVIARGSNDASGHRGGGAAGALCNEIRERERPERLLCRWGERLGHLTLARRHEAYRAC
jgi:hypothetical protein